MVDKYLRQGLHKGVPPLFVDLRSLYKDNNKTLIIQSLLLSYVDSLKSTQHFNPEGKEFIILVLCRYAVYFYQSIIFCF